MEEQFGFFCCFGLTPIVDYHNSILGGKSKVVRLEMRVAELEDLCRWEKVLSQLLNPVQKLELDLFEEQIKQRKERSGAN